MLATGAAGEWGSWRAANLATAVCVCAQRCKAAPSLHPGQLRPPVIKTTVAGGVGPVVLPATGRCCQLTRDNCACRPDDSRHPTPATLAQRQPGRWMLRLHPPRNQYIIHQACPSCVSCVCLCVTLCRWCHRLVCHTASGRLVAHSRPKQNKATVHCGERAQGRQMLRLQRALSE